MQLSRESSRKIVKDVLCCFILSSENDVYESQFILLHFMFAGVFES